jgi:hypothetical protein
MQKAHDAWGEASLVGTDYEQLELRVVAQCGLERTLAKGVMLGQLLDQPEQVAYQPCKPKPATPRHSEAQAKKRRKTARKNRKQAHRMNRA